MSIEKKPARVEVLGNAFAETYLARASQIGSYPFSETLANNCKVAKALIIFGFFK